MKAVYLIPPVVAVAIAWVLLGTQRQKISRMEDESVLLQKHIAEEKNRADHPSSAPDPLRPTKPEAAGEEIDWKEIAESFGEMKSGSGVRDMRKKMAFQRRLQKMDTEQLLAALAQIQALDWGDEERMMLESMLIGPLTLKDPERALNRFSDRINEERMGMSWQLANALGEWAKKDQAAAIAWFDKQIAAGTFDSKSLDGKSNTRLNFEKSLISKLLSTDPAAAGARIAALPADQRKDALEGFGYQGLKPEDQAAYANLVRSQLSEDERYEVFGQQASMLAMMGSLEKVDGFLDRIGATGEERVKAAEKAATGSITGKAHQAKVTEEKIDSMREWLGTQAPGSVDKITGEALGQVASQNGGMNFSDATSMVLKYHGESGNDVILTSFLENSYHSGDKEESRRIAEQISDPKKREQALENLK